MREHVERLGRLGLLHVDVAELEVRAAAARIELLRALEADDGLVDLAGGAVGERQVVGREQVRRIQGERPLVGGDRLGVAPRLVVDVAEPRVAFDHLRIDGQRLQDLGGGLVVATGLRVRAGQLQQVVELDGVLRVATRAIFQMASRGRPDVAKRAQSLFSRRVDGLRPLRGLGTGGLRDQRSQRPLHPVGARGIAQPPDCSPRRDPWRRRRARGSAPG